ncbi:hypothetical protein EVAR_36137_1 [Eumeta japonica]|uniref:Uncharacterized protein n=1 Tax=Eumeta variegata TaxID=151549 RepID=A0A4C1X5K1_EUMVA|nr:hypothetical protein EVAR_36137_1 [Eumeta japonica]
MIGRLYKNPFPDELLKAAPIQMPYIIRRFRSPPSAALSLDAHAPRSAPPATPQRPLHDPPPTAHHTTPTASTALIFYTSLSLNQLYRVHRQSHPHSIGCTHPEISSCILISRLH